MNYQSLYQQFKQKQLHSRQMQENELMRIQALCNEPKINMNSTNILLKRTMQILQQFDDQQMVNLQTSIPVFQAVGILQVLRSVVQAKIKLQNAATSNLNGTGGVAGEARLRNQAQFLYHFWNLVDQDQIQCKRLKQIIQLIQSKKKNQIKFILKQTFKDEQKIQRFVQCWTQLTANQQFYKHMGRTIPSKHVQSYNNYMSNNKQNTIFQSTHQNTSQYNNSFSSNNHKNHKTDHNNEDNLGSPIYQTYHKSSQSSNKHNRFNTISNLNPNSTHTQEFGYTCMLNHEQEKQLVERLYKNDIYRTREEQKKEMEQNREKEELKECTFKPNIIKRGKSVNSYQYNNNKSYSQIKGYDKAINRLKAGNEKNKISKQMRDYKPTGQNYQKLKQKGINPPKFLQRKKKQEQKVLFVISFDLGRHKTNVKIKQGDTEQLVAERICKIYSLKKQFYQEIQQVVKKQLDNYYQQQKRQKQNYNERNSYNGYEEQQIDNQIF